MLQHPAHTGTPTHIHRCRLNVLLAMNVVLGIAQIGVAGSKMDSTCSKPLASILMVCGVVNFVQVSVVL